MQVLPYQISLLNYSLVEVASMEAMWRRTWNGTGLTWFCGWGFLLLVGPVLELQAGFQRPLTVYPRVLVPNCSERLANGAYGVLHYSGSNMITAGADVTMALLSGEGGEDRYIVPVRQE